MESNKFPKCLSHSPNELEWVCLEKVCDKRLLCQVCVITNHMQTHKNYVQAKDLMIDPLVALNITGNTQQNIKKIGMEDLLSENFNQEKEKLHDLFQKLSNSLNNKLEKLKTEFNEEAAKFIECNQEIMLATEEKREDFRKFANNYFPSINNEDASEMKEAFDIILSKYFDEKEGLKQFDKVLSTIPKVITKEAFELSVGGIKLENLIWKDFAKISGLTDLSFDPSRNCGDILFSNFNLTVKKKGGPGASTVFGKQIFTSGVIEWKAVIDIHQGIYFCIGILPVKDWKMNVDNWAGGPCICTDNKLYGVDYSEGQINLHQGSVINFKLDFEQDNFYIEGEGGWMGRKGGIKGGKWTTFVSWPANVQYQVTFKEKE